MTRNVLLAAILVCGVVLASFNATRFSADADSGEPALAKGGATLTSLTLPTTQDAKKDTDAKKAPKKKVYPKADPNMGQIAGIVTLKGPKPKLPPFVVDPANKDIGFCKKHVKDERLLVGPKGTIKNVVVTLHKYKPKPGKKAKKRKVTINNKGCLFVPHVLATTCGSDLELKNSDPFLHNCRGVLDMAFNVAIPQGGVQKKKVPRKEGFCIVLCDFHPWMQSRVHFFPHEFFDVTDEKGGYRLVNVPPGKYTVEVRHELLCSKFTPVLKKDIVVEKGKTTKLDVAIEAKKK